MQSSIFRVILPLGFALLFVWSAGCRRDSETTEPNANSVPANTNEADDTVDETADKAAPTPAEPSDRPSENDGELPAIDMSRLSASKQDQIRRAQQRAADAPGSANRIGELGMQYLALGFDDAAIRCFDMALERVPSAMQYFYLRALAYQTRGGLDEAERDFRTSIELDPKYTPAYVNLAKILELKNDASACDLFRQAVEMDPKDVIALHGLAGCEQKKGDTDAAINLLNRALDVQPDNADAHFALSQIYRKAGKNSEAESHLSAYENGKKPVVTNDPLRFEVTRRTRDEADIAREAIEIAKAGHSARAAEYLERALNVGIDGPTIRSALGGVYLAQRQFNLAVVQFRAGLSQDPNSLELRSNLAHALAETGNLEEAEPILREIINESPKDAVSMNRLAMLLVHRGQTDEAAALLTKAIAADAESHVSRLNLADLLINSGKIDEGKSILDPIAESSSFYGRKLFLLGLIDARAGRLNEAQDLWMRAIKATPDLEQAYAALAEVMLVNNRTADALKVMIAGINNAPAAADLKNNAAWILATSPDDSIRNGTLAVALAESANELDRYQRHNFVGTLAAAYAEAGRFDEAERTARRAADMARKAGLDKDAAQHDTRASLYAEHKPYRAPTAP